MNVKKVIAILLLISIISAYFPQFNLRLFAVNEKNNNYVFESIVKVEEIQNIEESESGNLIYESTELVEALANQDIKRIDLCNNITIENITDIPINGSNKIINGNNFKLIINGYCNIVANDIIKELKDLTIETSDGINMTLKNGGVINNVNAPNTNIIVIRSDVTIVSSDFKHIEMNSSNESEIHFSKFNTVKIEYSTVDISDSYIKPNKYETGIYAGTWSNVNVKNTEINGGSIGIHTDLNGSTMILENVSIENSETYGIYNNGDVNGSYLILNGVNIINCSNYGIYNTGNGSRGDILIKNKLLLENSMIGVYLKNGCLQIEKEGIIEDKKCIYSVFKDINSTIYDDANILVEERNSDGGIFYNSNTKETTDINLKSIKVKSETEVIEALKDKDIYIIELLNDIDISTNNIITNGVLKLVDGKENKLIFNNPDFIVEEFYIIAENYLELSNINIESNSIVNIQMNLGGSFNKIISDKVRVNSNGTITVTNSKLRGISITNGKSSSITNSDILSEGINIYTSKDITIENTNINYESDKNYIGILLSVYCSGIIKNISIKNSSIGIWADLNGDTMTLENVSIENCAKHGIYNDGDVNGSHLILNGVNIINCAKYGIYNTGNGSAGNIYIKENLLLENNAIGIYLENGVLQIEKEGIIEDKGCIYSAYKDVNSIIYDDANILGEENSSGGGIFYNCKTKEATDINVKSIKVSNETEFIEALKDKEIYIIEILNDIEISTNSIITEGVLKLVDGKENKLIFNNPDFIVEEFYIIAENYLELLNINIESNSIVNIQMNLGGRFNKIISNKVSVNSNGTITVTNSRLRGISITNGKGSSIKNSDILIEGINIFTSENIIIEDTKINYESNKNYIGILLSVNCSGIIRNVSIKNSYTGIQSDLNGRTMTFENVSIENCETYGIYNSEDIGGSCLILNGVNIINCKEYAVYCDSGTSKSTIIVDNLSTLKLESQINGIYLKYGDFILNGSLMHNGDGIAVECSPQSTVIYDDNKLILVDNNGTDFTQYVTKENYKDIIPPEIKLIGDSVIELCISEKYEEYGAIATDNIDTDVNVNIYGIVDTSKEGANILKYIAKDSHGNENFVERTVIITNHHFGDWEIINESTCTKNGLKERTCDKCQNKEESSIEKKIHNWNEGYTIDKEATCTEKGQKSIHCSICNEIKEESEIEIKLKEHSWDEGEIIKQPTNTEEGIRMYTCQNCKHTKTETIEIKNFLIGDINGDGKVNIKDWNKLYNHINETNIIADYQLLCADVNKDGKVNIKDWNRLYNHITEVSPLW